MAALIVMRHWQVGMTAPVMSAVI